MTVRELIESLNKMVEDNQDVENATIVAEHGYRFYDVTKHITPIRYTPNGMAVVTLNLRKTDE